MAHAEIYDNGGSGGCPDIVLYTDAKTVEEAREALLQFCKEEGIDAYVKDDGSVVVDNQNDGENWGITVFTEYLQWAIDNGGQYRI